MPDKISIEERIAYIAPLPIFALLTHEELGKLSEFMDEQNIPQNQVIVQEGDAINIFYYIVEGSAKVLRELPRVGKTHIMDIKMLGPGDTIGFSEVGFFSATGLRASTVIAQSPMRCLTISIDKLHQYFEVYNQLYPDLEKKLEEFLLINFIKQTKVFQDISSAQLQHLKNHIKKLNIPAGKIIFHQGDVGDYCYYILSGEVEVQSDNQKMANLHSGQLFGERALISNDKRSATIIAKKECQLFAIEGQIALLYMTEKKMGLAERLMKKIKSMFNGHTA